ncbi:hypothetical protein ACHQM5_030846 [Ranunculus cassubicifolius]
MEGIEHRVVENGIKMHIAEIGKGPVVLFVHGFPELWYSWRHQMVSLAVQGYKAVAPDMRGYGDTDAPASSHCYTSFHIVGDLVVLIDLLGVYQVFVVGHDFGAYMAWHLCLFCADRVKAFVSTGLHFLRRDPFMKPIAAFQHLYGDDYDMCRFQRSLVVLVLIGRNGTDTVMKKLVTIFSKPGPPMLPKDTRFAMAPSTLPSWMSEEDLRYYASKFENTGLTGGLNYYRAFDLTWELSAPWTDAQIKVPVKLVVGELELMYNVPVVMEGVAHFIQQERPDEISKHIFDFIRK